MDLRLNALAFFALSGPIIFMTSAALSILLLLLFFL